MITHKILKLQRCMGDSIFDAQSATFVKLFLLINKQCDFVLRLLNIVFHATCFTIHAKHFFAIFSAKVSLIFCGLTFLAIQTCLMKL